MLPLFSSTVVLNKAAGWLSRKDAHRLWLNRQSTKACCLNSFKHDIGLNFGYIYRQITSINHALALIWRAHIAFICVPWNVLFYGVL